MKKIMIVFGTRPEAIKMAPLVKELKKHDEFEVKVCVTAQHREMLDQVLELFSIKPDFDLDIMEHGQTISDITNKIIKGMEGIFKEYKPDILLVHGDTTTTFASALAAFYQKIVVGHVEAGLRSGNIYSPYPEEMNRMLTGRIAKLHFSPTKGNEQNLLKENIEKEDIFITGNTVIDALMDVVQADYLFNNELDDIDFDGKKVALLTCHRRENWGKPMEDIFNAIKEEVETNEDFMVIFPMHLNPNIRKLAKKIMGNTNRIKLIEPLDYEPFANLIKKSHLILTDSGGIQEEAPAFGKPVLVLRTETERPEAVEYGTVKVVGVNKKDIRRNISLLLNNEDEYNKMKNATNPYGDGKACQRIAQILKERNL
ncbi:MAG: UDP-N-acetylglucosamine 2-epimerase (non-hydrolyzing) [Peptostreptococcaceae bacterium]|nr:UDP-N-acetylglucosamine 2-epimerase (non-hydrolyzing) [Peptostreptococcaceae bacterium]